MLQVSQLTRAYGDFIAVNDVSFTIAKGEIVGLLGHNGAGKTTIMKMLSGYLEPSSGSIRFAGQELSEQLKLLQQQIGYLPESLPVYPEMTVADYLDYAAELKGLRGLEKYAQIKRSLKATDIGCKLLAPIATLSRGYKQRVGVAQAILGEPKLLILDEPTNGLDPAQTQQMRDLIRQLAQEATVILSTHIMQEVDAICDRVLMMRQGRLVVDARLDQLQQGRHLRLICSSISAEVQAILSHLPGVKQVELLPDTGEQSLRIELQENADLRGLSAAVAKTLVTSGIELYQLHSEVRDLETLFREVNQQEVRHAA